MEEGDKKVIRIECDNPDCVICQEGGVVEVDEHQPWTAWTCPCCSVVVVDQKEEGSCKDGIHKKRGKDE